MRRYYTRGRRYEERYRTIARGGFLHVFNRGVGRQMIFRDDDDYRFYLGKLERLLRERRIRVLAYCLMPNHIHLLVQQIGEEPVARLISALHTSYARRFNGKYRRVGHVFQGRFRQAVIRRDTHLNYLVAYLHLNPVEAGLAIHPSRYQWSSWLAYAKGTKIPACDPRPLLRMFGGPAQYRAFEDEIIAMRRKQRWVKIRDATIE